MCRQAHIIRRSRHHSAKPNIICRRQASFKKRTFVGRQKCVFCWQGWLDRFAFKLLGAKFSANKGNAELSKTAFAVLRVLRLATPNEQIEHSKRSALFVGRASWTRTSECKSQSLVPYRLGDSPITLKIITHQTAFVNSFLQIIHRLLLTNGIMCAIINLMWKNL